MATTHGTAPRTGLTLAIIGCGTMGSAILSGVMESCAKTISSGGEPRISSFVATVSSKDSAETLRGRFSEYSDRLEVIQGENVNAMERADIVLLAFKPYMIDNALKVKGVRAALSGKLVISVLVGSPSEKLEAAIYYEGSPGVTEKAIFIKRAMLNLAAELRESMTVIETTSMSEFNEDISNWIFLQVGKITSVAPEQFDIGGVLAGPSGALMSVAFDGILDGAVSQGLKRAEAKKILTQALFSLAKLLESEHPAVLREKFASPKGTTIDGLLSLEEDRARYAFSKATIASSKRSQEIGKL